MRTLIQRHPGLTSGVLFGVLFGAAMAGLLAVTSDLRGWRLVIMAVGVGIAGGMFFGLLFPRAMRSMTTGLDQFPIERQRQVGQAARTGPAPTDPELHRLAAEFAARQLRHTRSWFFRVSLVLFAVFAIAAIWSAATTGVWWRGLGAVLFLGLLVMQVWDARRWRPRAEVLGVPTR